MLCRVGRAVVFVGKGDECVGRIVNVIKVDGREEGLSTLLEELSLVFCESESIE